jgi:hypothetical protein
MGLQLAIVAFGPRWQFQAGNFILMGWGFYMIHGSLQVFASELSVEARATALSLHSFFLFHGPDHRTDRLRVWHSECRQATDLAGERGCNHRARRGLRASAAADEAGRCGTAKAAHARDGASPRGCGGNIGRSAWPLGHYPLRHASLALAGILLSATISLYLKGKCAWSSSRLE